MSRISSLFESIANDINPSESSQSSLPRIRSISQQYLNTESIINSTKYVNNNREIAEILFDLFPSIFMPYLDVYTFCNLLKTDLWNWHHLLSERIIYDYCNYISIRNQSEIDKFCEDCQSYSSYSSYSCSTLFDNDNNDNNYNSDSCDSCDSFHSFDSFDSYNSYNSHHHHLDNNHNVKHIENIKNIKGAEQNFAVLKIITNQIINNYFIYKHFKNIDIIYDRMSLIQSQDIGLTTNLCKNITINTNKTDNHNDNNNDIIFECNTLNELESKLLNKKYYNKEDLKHIKNLLITDILFMCVDKWYFVEWHQMNKYQIIDIKQMIIGHFHSKKNKNDQNQNHSMEQQLFVVWSIEWQQIASPDI